MKTSSPLKKKSKRKRSNYSNDESIYSFRDELRDKDDDIELKELQLIKYEDKIDTESWKYRPASAKIF